MGVGHFSPVPIPAAVIHGRPGGMNVLEGSIELGWDSPLTFRPPLTLFSLGAGWASRKTESPGVCGATSACRCGINRCCECRLTADVIVVLR